MKTGIYFQLLVARGYDTERQDYPDAFYLSPDMFEKFKSQVTVGLSKVGQLIPDGDCCEYTFDHIPVRLDSKLNPGTILPIKASD